jgi:PTH1 family peptidyl-tRNA hydrolase
MKIIVGLGNPGEEYENTRHNLGFKVMDTLSEIVKIDVNKKRLDGLVGTGTYNCEKIVLVKPQTYMNLSGVAVRKFVDFYNLKLDDLLVIYDDVDFEVGKFKIKRGGSSGGHNGINNVIENLKTNEINRIRIGISKNEIPLIDYVLGKFSKEEDEKINSILETISNIIDDFSVNNINKLMEKYNRKNE